MASNRITLEQAAGLLKEADDILILTHKSPDGDTLGSGYGLMHACHFRHCATVI